MKSIARKKSQQFELANSCRQSDIWTTIPRHIEINGLGILRYVRASAPGAIHYHGDASTWAFCTINATSSKQGDLDAEIASLQELHHCVCSAQAHQPLNLSAPHNNPPKCISFTEITRKYNALRGLLWCGGHIAEVRILAPLNFMLVACLPLEGRYYSCHFCSTSAQWTSTPLVHQERLRVLRSCKARKLLPFGISLCPRSLLIFDFLGLNVLDFW